jgi:hypothetical protein
VESGPTDRVLRQPENEKTKLFLNGGLVIEQLEHEGGHGK